MCDSKHLIVDFLQENAISRKQFHMNCADIGLWQAEVALTPEDFRICRHWDADASDDEEPEVSDPDDEVEETLHVETKRARYQ